jgi:hypothetical protein
MKGLSLGNIIAVDSSLWEPSLDTHCIQHLKYPPYEASNNIIFNTSPTVGTWKSETVGYHASQLTANDQPTLQKFTTGGIYFDGANAHLDFLEYDLTGEFTIGWKGKCTSAVNYTIIASNTAVAHDFIRINDTSSLRVKIDGVTKGFPSDNLGEFDGEFYFILARNSSNLITLWVNGVKATTTSTLAGTFSPNAIAVRTTDTNDFIGDFYDISVFTSTSDDLTDNLNQYLADIPGQIL